MSEQANNTAKAEAAARRNGYTGQWPPPPRRRLDTAASLQTALADLAGGELAASLVDAVTTHLIEFFAALAPDDFRVFGETIMRIVFWDELTPDQRGNALGKGAAPTPRVRLRAIKSAVKPMLDVLAEVGKLGRQRNAPPPLLKHLLECVYAFFAPFGGENMARLAGELRKLANQRAEADLSIRALQLAVQLVTNGVSAALDANIALAPPPTPLDEERMKATREELQRMLNRAQQRPAKREVAA